MTLKYEILKQLFLWFSLFLSVPLPLLRAKKRPGTKGLYAHLSRRIPQYYEKLYITTLPTTIFVNRDGLILMPPIEGVPEDLSRYEQLIDAFVGAGTSAQ